MPTSLDIRGSTEPEGNPKPKKNWVGIILLILAILLLIYLVVSTTVFEDGSFGIGSFPYLIKGCLPGGICG